MNRRTYMTDMKDEGTVRNQKISLRCALQNMTSRFFLSRFDQILNKRDKSCSILDIIQCIIQILDLKRISSSMCALQVHRLLQWRFSLSENVSLCDVFASRSRIDGLGRQQAWTTLESKKGEHWALKMFKPFSNLSCIFVVLACFVLNTTLKASLYVGGFLLDRSSNPFHSILILAPRVQTREFSFFNEHPGSEGVHFISLRILCIVHWVKFW